MISNGYLTDSYTSHTLSLLYRLLINPYPFIGRHVVLPPDPSEGCFQSTQQPHLDAESRVVENER